MVLGWVLHEPWIDKCGLCIEHIKPRANFQDHANSKVTKSFVLQYMFDPSTCKDFFRSTSRLPTIVATNDVTYKFGLLKCYWWKYFDRDLHHAYEHDLLGQHLFALPCVLYLSLNISKYFGISTFDFGSPLYFYMYNEC